MSYSDEVRIVRNSFMALSDCFSLRYVFRPLSFWATPFFDRRGWTPNAVTYLRCALALLGAVFVGMGGGCFGRFGFFCFFASIVADFVDGNLARIQDKASFYGKFLDGLVDGACQAFFIVGVGYAASVENGSGLYLLFASVTSLLFILTVYSMSRFAVSSMMIESVLDKYDEHVQVRYRESTSRKVDYISDCFVYNFLLVAFFVSILTMNYVFLFILICVPFLAWSVSNMYICLVNASRAFDIHRVSVHLRVDD